VNSAAKIAKYTLNRIMQKAWNSLSSNETAQISPEGEELVPQAQYKKFI